MATLAQYSFTSTTAPTTQATNVNAGSILNQSLSAFAIEPLGYATDNVLRCNPTDSSTTPAEAISTGNFFYFSIAPSAGKTLSLNSLDFNIARGGAATPRGYDVRSSVDTYATTLGTADIPTVRTTFTAVSIDLTGASFQNLSSSTTFRVFLYSPSSSFSIELDDITVDGTVADGGTVEQEGFRFFNDDGSESASTGKAAQDANIIEDTETPVRLRVLLNGTLDRGAENYRLEYREVGQSTWSQI